METRIETIAGWFRLVRGLALMLALFGWGLFAPSASESGGFSYRGATLEALGENTFRVRHACTTGNPIAGPGCYFGDIHVNTSSFALELIGAGVDTPPSSGGGNSGSSELKVEGTITAITKDSPTTGDVTITVLGEAGTSGVTVVVNGSTIVVFEDAPTGFSLGSDNLAGGQPVKAEGNPLDSTAGIQATKVEVEEVKVKGPITMTESPTPPFSFNGVALACRLTIFSSGVKVLVPTTFTALCSASGVVEVEGVYVDTNMASSGSLTPGNGSADSILIGNAEEEEEED